MPSLSEPLINEIIPRRVAGMSVRMSLNNNRTRYLWQAFHPAIPRISGRIGQQLYSLQVYDNTEYFSAFDPAREFTRWAAVELGDDFSLPQGIQTIQLGGLYAQFHYQGSVADFPPFAQQIYQVWLPNSGYRLDHRPHFEILPVGYRPDDPLAEEDIYVPVITARAQP